MLDWFDNTLQSRVNSADTPIIVIMQRLQERDLAGWLLGRKPGEEPRPGGNGEVWEHVCFEALSEDGEALWPEKHTAADLNRMRESMPYVFSGQYQQQPSPGDSGIIKTAKIETVDALPAGLQFVRGWDLAGTEAKMKRGYWTVGAKLGRSQDGVIYIADVLRERMGPDEVETAIGNTGKADMVLQSIPQDPGQAGKAQVMHLSRKLYGVPAPDKPTFVIWGLLDRGPSETAGTPFGDYIREMERWLAEAFGSSFCPVRQFLASPYAFDVAARLAPGFLPTPDDTAAVAAKTVPPSFRVSTNSVHLNVLGHKLQAWYMHQHLIARGII